MWLNKFLLLAVFMLLARAASKQQNENIEGEAEQEINEAQPNESNETNPEDYVTDKRSENANVACPNSNCEGCELLFGTDPLDVENFQFPAVTSTPGTTTGAEDAKMKNTFKKFVSLLIGISHLVPPPFGPRIRAGHGIFTSLLALASGENTGLWEKVERRVEAKIEQYATYDHFKDITNNGFWARCNDILRTCPNFLRVDDLKFMLAKKLQIFPQNNDDVSFTPYWAVAMNSWMLNIAATYLELIRIGKLEACNFHEELKALRPDVINALKSLHSKRWRSIRGHDYDSGYKGDRDASLQFKDESTGELWPKRFTWWDVKRNRIQDTISKTFKHIRDDTKGMVDTIRQRFNSILRATSELRSGCSGGTIADIPVSVNNINYPSGCYGTPIQGGWWAPHEKPCLLPCELYGTGSYFCPNDEAMDTSTHRMDKKGNMQGSINNGRCSRKTEMNAWRQCNPDGYKSASQSVVFTASWGARQNGDKKKKKKEKKKTDAKI